MPPPPAARDVGEGDGRRRGEHPGAQPPHGRGPLVPGGGLLRPLRAGRRRPHCVAQRVLHLLHPLPAGDEPGHAPGPVRVPEPHLRAHRHGRRQLLALRRRHRPGGGGAHVRPPQQRRAVPRPAGDEPREALGPSQLPRRHRRRDRPLRMGRGRRPGPGRPRAAPGGGGLRRLRRVPEHVRGHRRADGPAAAADRGAAGDGRQPADPGAVQAPGGDGGRHSGGGRPMPGR